jgi:serine/alanine adding enzyme
MNLGFRSLGSDLAGGAVRTIDPVTELAEVEPARWDDLLGRLGLTDAYAAYGFVRASAALVDATPMLLHLAGEGGDIAFPLLLREDPRDVVSPYGYGGPLGAGAEPPFAAFHEAYTEWCAARGVLTSFVVFHPLYRNDAHAKELGFRRVPLGGTVAWPLAGDLRARMHRHHRRMVRRAEGLVASVAPDPADLTEFVALYLDAMRRLDASPFYSFGPAYWDALLCDAPLVRVDVRDMDGALVAGVLGMGTPPWLHYHLGASTADGRGSGASHLALTTLAEWGRDRGFEVLHLGGGVGGRADSLLEYKVRFAPHGLVPSATGRAIHDPAAYARLTGADGVDWDGFFPAYRATA